MIVDAMKPRRMGQHADQHSACVPLLKHFQAAEPNRPAMQVPSAESLAVSGPSLLA
jgi:hypothetical protein